jgi:putative transposase
MAQIARNLTYVDEQFLAHTRFLIMDRDTKYTDSFRGVLARHGVNVIRLPPRSRNLNAFAERFMRSVKEECVGRMIFLGRRSLGRALAEYIAHYHGERNHQGLGNRLLEVSAETGTRCQALRRRQRLGGMLSFYYRAVAA